MDRRYQVFISSTYTDLQDERQKVMQTVMEMDCFPAGMELFPAFDEEQLEFIKKIIDDCDYYIIIIGGRYGSTTAEGVSYTEKEYDYAVEKGLKVIALLHGSPGDIPQGKSETNIEARERLEAFRTKVSKGRIVKFWSNADELPGLVALSLQKTIKTYPGRGWVRGDTETTTELLSQINQLRVENKNFLQELAELKQRESTTIPDIATGKDIFKIRGRVSRRSHGVIHEDEWFVEMTWDEIFGIIGPKIMEPKSPKSVKIIFERYFEEHIRDTEITISTTDFETIALQLKARGLVTIFTAGTGAVMAVLFWQISDQGMAYLLQLRVQRASVQALEPPAS